MERSERKRTRCIRSFNSVDGGMNQDPLPFVWIRQMRSGPDKIRIRNTNITYRTNYNCFPLKATFYVNYLSQMLGGKHCYF